MLINECKEKKNKRRLVASAIVLALVNATLFHVVTPTNFSLNMCLKKEFEKSKKVEVLAKTVRWNNKHIMGVPKSCP